MPTRDIAISRSDAPGRSIAVDDFMPLAEVLNERHQAKHFAQVSRDDLRMNLTRALASLPEMYREVIVLRDKS